MYLKIKRSDKMGLGLEGKRITYALSNKNIGSEKMKILSELSSANERYGEEIRRTISKIKEECNLMMNYEIEMRNSKETKVADILLDTRTKLIKAESHLRSAVNTLI